MTVFILLTGIPIYGKIVFILKKKSALISHFMKLKKNIYIFFFKSEWPANF